MIDLIEEKATFPSSKKIRSLWREDGDIHPASGIRGYLRSCEKWLYILDNWKEEADLIDRVLNISLVGERNFIILHQLHEDLEKVRNSEIRSLEKDIRVLLKSIEFNYANLDAKVYNLKEQIQRLSAAYLNLKIRILHEIIRTYPIQIL